MAVERSISAPAQNLTQNRRISFQIVIGNHTSFGTSTGLNPQILHGTLCIFIDFWKDYVEKKLLTEFGKNGRVLITALFGTRFRQELSIVSWIKNLFLTRFMIISPIFLILLVNHRINKAFLWNASQYLQ